MVLVKINTPVHYHVKNYRICKNKICQGPGTLFDGNMVVSAGMAHIMNYHRNCSASGMFVFNSIPSFMELWRNYIYGFMQRLNNSDNTVVATTVSSCRMSSAMWRRWESILYTKTSCLFYPVILYLLFSLFM